MIFRRISYRIAAQFTAFVFALLLTTGGIFLAADIVRRDRTTHERLRRLMQPIIEHSETFGTLPAFTSFERQRVRIVNIDGSIIYSGALFQDIPFRLSEDIQTVASGHDTYVIATASVFQDGQLVGYIQVGDRSPQNDLPQSILMFFLISGGISILTFGIGLFFARRSLKPAEHMMQRLEQFTQDASHELRTPLTAVSTSLDLALRSEDSTRYVQNAKHDLKAVFVLVERLLELARLDTLALKKEPVDLHALLTDVLAKHQSIAQEKKIIMTSSLQHVVTDADPTLVRQVAANVLMNAIKFTPSHGKISVTLMRHSMVFHDTGKGISPEALPHIFDRFYQEDGSRTKSIKGVGLGLALVKRIVDLHGWNIVFESTAGKGTTCTVKFG